jgi:hypothetical protein
MRDFDLFFVVTKPVIVKGRHGCGERCAPTMTFQAIEGVRVLHRIKGRKILLENHNYSL